MMPARLNFLIIISIFLACYHVAKHEKIVLLWGPLFMGAPVRPNMLNMPKSASDDKKEHHHQLHHQRPRYLFIIQEIKRCCEDRKQRDGRKE